MGLGRFTFKYFHFLYQYIDLNVIYFLKPSDSPYVMETLLVDDILDIWQQAQIVNGRSILLALGFDDRQINVSQLHKALEEEIRGINEPHQLTLLKASLALQTTELNTLRQISRQCYEENRKLRADNKDANRRIAIFTAEIDERHASLEDATRKEVISKYVYFNISILYQYLFIID